MARILAIDYGSKRVGFAVTDPLQIIATPLVTVEARKAMDFIRHYVSTEVVECFVIGYPLRLDGSPAHATPLVEQFITSLARKFPGIPVKKVDETFTSQMAARALASGNFKKKDRRKKENLDKISAALILQQYLQSIHK